MPSGIYKHKKGYKRPPYSKEWKENLSKSLKGRLAWNKGIKGLQKWSEETRGKMKNRISLITGFIF